MSNVIRYKIEYLIVNFKSQWNKDKIAFFFDNTMFDEVRKTHYEKIHKLLLECIHNEDYIEDYDNVLQFFHEHDDEVNMFNFIDLIQNSETAKFSKEEIDEIGKKIFPDDTKDLEPIKCLGDGNCLYNAISMLLIKSNELHLELRIKTVYEIMMNRLNYDIAKYSNYSAASSNGFEDDIIKSLRKGSYSSIRHVSALCEVLNCNVVSIYPKVNSGLVNRSALHTTFEPLINSFKTKIKIMWSHTVNSQINLQNWSPNHFLPCVNTNQISEPSQKVKYKPASSHKPTKRESSISTFF